MQSYVYITLPFVRKSKNQAIHSQFCRKNPTFYKKNQKRHSILLGWKLPASHRWHQKLSHFPSYQLISAFLVSISITISISGGLEAPWSIDISAMERSIDVNMFDREDWTMKDGSFVVWIIGCGLDIGLWADCFLYEPLVIGLSWADYPMCTHLPTKRRGQGYCWSMHVSSSVSFRKLILAKVKPEEIQRPSWEQQAYNQSVYRSSMKLYENRRLRGTISSCWDLLLEGRRNLAIQGSLSLYIYRIYVHWPSCLWWEKLWCYCRRNSGVIEGAQLLCGYN